MQISTRGYRSWRTRPVSQRSRTDMAVLAHIREQYSLSLGSAVYRERPPCGQSKGPPEDDAVRVLGHSKRQGSMSASAVSDG